MHRAEPALSRHIYNRLSLVKILSIGRGNELWTYEINSKPSTVWGLLFVSKANAHMSKTILTRDRTNKLTCRYVVHC